MHDGNFEFLEAEGAELGSSSPGVEQAQAFLERFGYLARPQVEAFTRGTFDGGTSQALRQYQQFHGLPVTGALDGATMAEMSKPRCGFPDFPDVAEFSLDGRKWQKDALTYRFENFSGDLGEDAQRDAIRAAFDLWQAQCGLTFSEAGEGEEADIVIGWHAGDHGDGSSFDGAGQVLAHAFFPPPNGGALAGDCHFDEAETWEASLPIPGASFDLVTVAAHEFGHSIGLRHSSVRGALMFPTYEGPHRHLHPDDVSGAQAMYGPVVEVEPGKGWGKTS